ncbi:MAG TPA: NfeD family protein [Anaerovoracaceae bacterium]|nr:NfeD family protein [Anaerovoracaceae bacterium]
MDIPMYLLWLALAIVLGIAEALTLGLSSIWFAIGALLACIIAMLNGPLTLQIIAFFAVSIILMIFTRPILVDKLNIGKEKTNVDAIIDKTGTVTVDIAPFKSGRAYINGLDWNAISEDNINITKDTKVKVVAIEGVKVIVKPLPEEVED